MTSKKIIEHTDTFEAVSEDGQQRITVLEYTDCFETNSSSGPQRVKGHNRYETSDGQPLNCNGEGVFELVHSKQVFRRA